MKQVAVIIQARMGSTRLPGKVLKPLCGLPVLWHIIHRVKAAKIPGAIIVATSTKRGDNPIEDNCRHWGIPCYRGEEDDVLKRYYGALTFLDHSGFSADNIVRITADCPLIDPVLIDKGISIAQNGGWDYISNTQPPSFPDGLDVEVISRRALVIANSFAKKRSDREHVTPFIISNPRFSKKNFHHACDLSNLRWTLDTAEDFTFIRAIYEELFPQRNIFSMTDILTLLQKKPELTELAGKIQRNEQYYLMIRKEHELEKKYV